MNLKILIMFPLVFSQSWTKIITRDINVLRTEYSLPSIVYNYTLHNELISVVNSTWQGYMYEINKGFCIKFPFNRSNCLKGYSLNPLGSYLLCHDTIVKPERIKLIIKQRIAQKKCLVKNCTGEHWTTCFKDPSFENLFSPSPCIYAHHYILKFLLKDLKYIACIILHYESGYSPIYQPYSFMCYGNSHWFSQTSNLIKTS